ncbi:Dynamin-1-like protein [Strongyloides ratti]|uniref:Dynamin-1-like protein n=1 Tax=Strongyloides ratti TaxID=34506 RepID=A0A090LBJ4_STRRB|nr:Dynamin-1-like protein [Strongyloides ratti]CEF64895.1 Dynamin-1-like protein [Strongyloides ratti]
MEELLPVINRLQSIFAITGTCYDIVQLPQIVVVGSQSSGKSSVLESIVGRDFLPRGSGIVTRRPLLLQLIHVTEEEIINKKQNSSSTDDYEEEWAIFDHDTETTYTDFNLVRKEIIKETDKESGTNKGISDKPIGLKIYSSKVINLSLIDLPGLTKVAVGEQPENIEQQISDLILKYINNPNAIILAVSPANQDFANSEAIKYARSVDKDGSRTIAVLTKLDLMDNGTDATEVLTGKVVPVKLGIVGVVNRSQSDIDNNKLIKESLKDEIEFLQKKYPTLVHKNGTLYLSKLLNKILLGHIKKNLPQLKEKVNGLMQQFQNEVYMIGEPTIDKSRALLNILTKFNYSYCSVIDGRFKNIETSELCGGARISYVFHETFAKAIQSIDPSSDFTEEDILTAMRNSRGIKTSLYIPEECFELLVKQQIKRLEEPSLNCVDIVHEELIRLLQNCGTDFQQEIYRFPVLGENINKILRDLLKKRLEPTKKFIENLIAIEIAYINTKNPEFEKIIKNTNIFSRMKENNTMRSNKNTITYKTFDEDNLENVIPQQSILKNVKDEVTSVNSETYEMATAPCFTPRYSVSNEKIGYKLSELEKNVCQWILKLTKEYFNITRNRILDSIPKAIMHFLVNDIRANLHNELVRNLYDKSRFDELLVENDEIEKRRQHSISTLDALQKAVKILSEIKETVIF